MTILKMSHRSVTSQGSSEGERGTGIVEFAIVALLLFTLSAGAFDYGQGWKSGLAVNEAARAGARVGSAGGPDRAADFNALSGVKAALQSSGLLEGVERVVVFNAASGTGKVPIDCKTNESPAPSRQCQVILGTHFRSDWQSGSYTAATTTSGCLQIAVAKNWCPTARGNAQATAQFYGIWIETNHQFMFPVLGSDITIERTAVMRLEPKVA